MLLKKIALAAVAGSALFAASAAQAQSYYDGYGYRYHRPYRHAPRVVYRPAPAYYYDYAPTYYAPAPVYYAPRPVYYGPQSAIYGRIPLGHHSSIGFRLGL